MHNPFAAYCPSCAAEICLRCIALEQRMDPDGLDGCADCARHLKRTERILRAHVAKDHPASVD